MRDDDEDNEGETDNDKHDDNNGGPGNNGNDDNNVGPGRGEPTCSPIKIDENDKGVDKGVDVVNDKGDDGKTDVDDGKSNKKYKKIPAMRTKHIEEIPSHVLCE